MGKSREKRVSLLSESYPVDIRYHQGLETTRKEQGMEGMEIERLNYLGSRIVKEQVRCKSKGITRRTGFRNLEMLPKCSGNSMLSIALHRLFTVGTRAHGHKYRPF